MSYKVKEGYARGDELVLSKQAPSPRVFKEPILSITALEGVREKFDITVDGNHNYLVDGVVVHNTMFGDPETMPGGQTMKFLSSLTIRVYGKNKIVKEIHPDLAAFKETNAVIKKAKVPITALSFEYEMCVYPSDGLDVGQTNSWNKVSSDLKQLGHLTKIPKGWRLEGPGLAAMEMPTLVTFQDTYHSDSDFATKLQSWIINSSKGQMFLSGATGAAL
jgi:hypothetical protein